MEVGYIRNIVFDRWVMVKMVLAIVVVAIAVGAVTITRGFPRVDVSETVSSPENSSDQPSTVERGVRATVELPRHRTSIESTWLAEHRLTPGAAQFIEEPALFGMPSWSRSPTHVERAELLIRGPALWADDRPDSLLRIGMADQPAADPTSMELESKIGVEEPSY